MKYLKILISLVVMGLLMFIVLFTATGRNNKVTEEIYIKDWFAEYAAESVRYFKDERVELCFAYVKTPLETIVGLGSVPCNQVLGVLE